jgi:SpoIID/LytB domain protein
LKKRLFILTLVMFFILSMFKVDTLAYSSVYYNNQIIKVALSSMSSNSLDITLSGDYTLDSEILNNGTSLTVQVYEGKLKIGEKILESVTITPTASNNFVTMKKGSDIRKYRGSLVLKVKNENIFAINIVNIEDYVKGVIGYEMSEYFHIEALKAQAVASRTYGIYKIKQSSEYDVVDSVLNQVYKGFNTSFAKVEQAVEATRGDIIFSSGYVIETLFSANNGGYSEDAVNVWGNPVAYLKAKKDDYDDYNIYENSRKYDWTVTYTAQQLTDKLNASLGTSGNTFIRIKTETIAFYNSGRVGNLEIEYKDAGGNINTKTLIRTNTRGFFGFKSSMYTVTHNKEADTYTFIGHGAGHGLGMSQIGALNRALGGQTYKEILSFYFTGAVVEKRISSILSASITESKLLTGDNLNLTVKGQSGSSSAYLYKYVIEKDGQIEEIIDYSNTSTLSYEINKIGNYNVTVYFKDVLSKDVYDDKRTISFNATGFADVNTDKLVDIFDLVLISKNLNKVKESSSDWNMKMDLAKDDVINILDLAKASQNYNVKY